MEIQASDETLERAATLETAQAHIWGVLTMLSFTFKQTRDSIRPRRYAISGKQCDACRTMKMASAVALIAARRSVWQDVSAASLELQYNRRGDALLHEVVIRVSQNGVMSETALQGLKGLLAKILDFAGERKALQTRRGNTDETLPGIVHDFVAQRFIYDIILYCFDKLREIISNRFKHFAACWKTIKGHSPNIAKKYGENLEHIIEMIEHLQTPDLARADGVDCLAVAILLSAVVLQERDVLEIDKAWEEAIVGAPRPLPFESSEDTGDLDDETDDDTMSNSQGVTSATCIVLRLLAKLARYYNAGFSLVIGVLRHLARVPSTTIRIATVEKTVQESYCSTGQTQVDSLRMLDDNGKDLRKKLGVPLLDEHSRQNLCANWKTVKKTSNLYMHAEVKLAMFCLANPNRHPLYGIIGVSKKLCLSCDLFFKALQNPKFDNAGPPIDFVFAATHKMPYDSWKIPKLPENSPIHKDANEKTLLERRIMLAILEVTDALGEQTKRSLEEAFGFHDTYSESSGDEIAGNEAASALALELRSISASMREKLKKWEV